MTDHSYPLDLTLAILIVGFVLLIAACWGLQRSVDWFTREYLD